MNQILEQKIQKFETRWNQLHKQSTPKSIKVDNDAEAIVNDKPYDTIKWSDIPIDKIEMIGSVMVYPSISYPGWWTVQSETSGITVSFVGPFAHKNAVEFANRWARDNERV